MRSKSAAVLASLILLASAVAACNGVLGIEEATLDTQTSASALCTLPLDDPSTECVTGASDACEECLRRGSTTLTSACLNEVAQPGQLKTCREALVDYRLCIGDDCRDENGNCAECLTGSPLAEQLKIQVRACPECRNSSIRSLCEEYCACMDKKCVRNKPADCEAACETLSPYQRYCRWTHCEWAESETSRHCSHAVGGDGACAEPQIDPADVCDGIWNGLACDEDDPLECCSGVCSNGICAAN